ncbi:MAG TPA: ABC transporter permease subunit [Candidatus Limnocylindrales bacterium]|nr:ABC transporter permease subunit [Candidatus Limnocylindrales bacterium]
MATSLRLRRGAGAKVDVRGVVRYARSIVGKTLRDSRRTTIIVSVLLFLMLVGATAAVASEFDTAAKRQQLSDVVRNLPPILQGLAGKPINVETMGGYVQYKYGTFFPIVLSLWSILALSSTLAAEAKRGSLEFVAASPIGRRRIAFEKLSGHIAVIAIASIAVFLSTAIAGAVNGKLPGDEISVTAAFAYALQLGLMALAAGGLAFALSQFLGRGAGVAIAGAVMFGGWILNGYQGAVPALAPFANLTWFGWTSNHLPLAGVFDWPSLVPVAIAVVLFLVIGVEAFARRDIGATSAVPTPSLPRVLVGVGGPAARSFGNGLSTALAWGVGIGLFGLVLAASAQAFVDLTKTAPDFVKLLQTAFPGSDILSVGGFLQLLFVQFGLILAGLAAATLVGAWASDETSGRLEMLLATPLARARWALSGGLAILGQIVVFTVIAAIGIAIGTAMIGGDVVQPIIGTFALGAFAAAFAGVGVAIAGVWRSSWAAPAVAILTIVTWFIDTIVPAFKLPDVIHQLALSAHYGLPMLGRWDAAGLAASAVLAVGGVVLGAVAFQRRDLRG